MLENYKWKYYDLRLMILILALDIIGVLAVSSATRGEARFVTRHILGVAIGFSFAFFISMIPYLKVLKFSIYIYIASIILLILVLLFGKKVGGATRWIVVPVIGQIQGSEFSKIGFIIFFSWLLAKYEEHLSSLTFLIGFGVLAIIPFYLILEEPDLSTTIVLGVSILTMLFVAGISFKWVFGSLAVVVPSVSIFIWMLLNGKAPSFIRQYQVNRILAWVDPKTYADASRQQTNSVMAIGSGQLSGKGLNNTTLASVKNGDFLSEEQTDFIFAVIGEEMGFIGCVIVIVLFALVVFECLYLAGKARDLQGRLICTGYAAIIAFQSFANISVATHIFPNTGLTLPFISYGVSSLFSLHIGLGLVLNVGLLRKA